MNKCRILHVITDLRPGGAQDNTIITANLQARSGNPVAVAAGPYRFRAEQLASVVTAIQVPSLRREISPFHDVQAAKELFRIIREWKPDVMHTHLSKAAALARLVAPNRLPTVHTMHTFPFHPGQSRIVHDLYVLLERFLARRTSAFIAVAPANVTKALSHRIGRRSQYHVVHSGMDTAMSAWASVPRDTVRLDLGVFGTGPLIGTVSRQVAQKNPGVFVDAARLVQDIRPDARFCVVGDGPLLSDIKRRAQAQGLVRIAFAGEQTDAPRWIRAFDVFVHTSLYEGMGRVLGEAMLVRTPIVATAVDGVVDAIGERAERGLGVAPNDPDALAAAVQSVLNNPVAAEQRTERAFEWARLELSDERMTAGIMDVYRGIGLAT